MAPAPFSLATTGTTTLATLSVTGGGPTLLFWDVRLTANPIGYGDVDFRLLRDGTLLTNEDTRAIGTPGGIVYPNHYLDNAPAGDHTYTLEIVFEPGATTDNYDAGPIRLTAMKVSSITGS